MTPVCIRCHQPIPLGTVAEPVMTRGGIRAQHPIAAGGQGCNVQVDDYPGGYLRELLEEAESHPFPAWRRYAKPTDESVEVGGGTR
jgi:hypothetical protein